MVTVSVEAAIELRDCGVRLPLMEQLMLDNYILSSLEDHYRAMGGIRVRLVPRKRLPLLPDCSARKLPPTLTFMLSEQKKFAMIARRHGKSPRAFLKHLETMPYDTDLGYEDME